MFPARRVRYYQHNGKQEEVNVKKQLSMLLGIIFCLISFPFQTLAVKVVVDPGHGGYDPGAIGVNRLQEKAVNLDIALKLRDSLVNKGYEVVMTRTTDTYVSLADRVKFAREQQPDLFVSIHANSYSNPSARGTMVLYYDNDYPDPDYPASEEMKALTPQSKELAQRVLDAIIDGVGTVNKGLVPSSVYVVRMGNVPSILVETAFLSNPQDASMLADEEFRSKLADAIERGIESYKPPIPDKAPNVFPDSLGHWARDAILRLKDEGVVEGIGNRFEPDRALTRAEWVTLMNRAFNPGQKPENSCSGTVAGSVYNSPCSSMQNLEYKDLQPNHWAYDIMKKAVAIGLINGYPDGTVRPDRPITRSEAAALFQRQLGTPAAWDGSATFTDVPADYWAAKAIYGLRQAEILEGINNETFMPERSITRAEAAAMLDRYLQKKRS